MTRNPKPSSPGRANGRQPIRNGALVDSFERGRRYLSLRRACLGEMDEGAYHPPALTRFGKDRVGRKIIAELAVELGTSEAILKLDAKFAAAVEIIVANCGEPALAVLFDGGRPQSKKEIFKLSRKSRERQHYRIELVGTGQATCVGPKTTDRVPDTMNFAKVLNRFARAGGSLSACHWLLSKHKAVLPRQLRDAMLETMRACEKEVRRFSKLQLVTAVNRVSSQAAAPSVQTTTPKLTFSGIGRQSKSALSLIAKNVRDLPTSSYDLRPSPVEFRVAKQECENLRRKCSEIAAELTRLSA